MGVSVMSLHVCLQMVTTQPANEHSIKQCVQKDYTHEQVLTLAEHTEKCVKKQVHRDFLLRKDDIKEAIKPGLHFWTACLTAFSHLPSLERIQYLIS